MNMSSDKSALRLGSPALLAIGIDNLAFLEELLGEAIGAEVVAEVERRLRGVVPQNCTTTVTRQRRFLVRMPATHQAVVRSMFEALQTVAAAEAIETERGPVAVTLSGGCTFADAADADAAERLHCSALQALHLAMARGIGSLEFARTDHDLVQARARLLDAATAATAANQLTLAYQPVFRASGGLSVSFHECLLRLQQPEGDLLSAAAFMPEVALLGLAPLIDRQVLDMAFASLAQHPNVRLSVNVFPQTMQDRRWMTLFEKALAQNPALAERLILEVTETCLMVDPARTREFMERLRRYGVCFALDDFGARHASLHYLRDFRFDILKIDARFVRDIQPGSDNAFFVETLTNIAKRFDMMTVAEAVQGPAEAECLAELGIEHFQGYYFGCPTLMLGPTSSPMPGMLAR
jgi:EAL domain-containing protein (putative c-di-GMP-specific phosphodiesterase class I)/GGDEF domain-containing protein